MPGKGSSSWAGNPESPLPRVLLHPCTAHCSLRRWGALGHPQPQPSLDKPALEREGDASRRDGGWQAGIQKVFGMSWWMRWVHTTPGSGEGLPSQELSYVFPLPCRFGCSFESVGPNPAPDSRTPESALLLQARPGSDPGLNLQQLPCWGVYPLSRTGSHWLKPKSRGQWPPIYCLPFGSRGGLEFNPPSSEKSVGVQETLEKSLEKPGAPGQCGEAEESEQSRAAWLHLPRQNKGCKSSVNHGNGINLKLSFQGEILVVATVCFCHTGVCRCDF